MKAYKPISDREVARRLGVRSIHTAYYYLQIIQEIYDAGLIICERVSTDEPQGEWIMSKPEEEGFGTVFQCSQCSYEVDYVPTNFCPNCGCRMKGANDAVDAV